MATMSRNDAVPVFVSSKAPSFEITDDLPHYAEYAQE
jgi:hypothetical protein